MSNGQNTGRRYIPKFFTYDGSTEWRPNVAYSAKTIVTRNFKVYTSIVNVPSNVGAPEDNPKYWQPAVITDEVMQTIIDELGKLDGNVSEVEHRVEVIENEVGELEVVIGDVQDDVDQLNNAFTDLNNQIVNKADIIVSSASGAVASFKDGASGNLPMRSVVCNIEPVQSGSGDPSPTNVRPISGFTRLNLHRTGINIWDEEWELGDLNTNTGENYPDNNRIRSKNYIPIKPETNYYVCSSVTGTVCYYDINKSYIGNRNIVAGGGIITTLSRAAFMRFSLNSAYGTTYNNDISINYPSADTDYHAYDGNTYTVDWQSTVGTVYGGTLDVTTGVLTAIYGIATFDGSDDENIELYSNRNGFTFRDLTGMASGNFVSGLCNQALVTIGDVTSHAVRYIGDSSIWLYAQDDLSITTVADMRTYLSTTPIQFVYELATPTTYQLTPQEIDTLLGTNNVWCDTGDTSVSYPADTKLYTEKELETVNVLRLSIAPVEDGTTASQAYTQGKYFFHNGDFCKAKTDIASGATFTLNTNYEVTTVAAELFSALS